MLRIFAAACLLPCSLFALVPTKVQGIEEKGPSSRVTVYYVTDRKPTADRPPLSPYGTARSKDVAYGVAHVSIPLNHTIGVMEEARKWKGQFSPNVARDVVFLDYASMTDRSFFDAMQHQTTDGGPHSALIVIHGFWTNFDEAIRRAAQVKYDIKFDGPVIIYTWPSYGDGVLYVADENNAEWTVYHFRSFLLEFSREVKANTDVIAHSMGNRILAHALEGLTDCSGRSPVHLNEVVLAAPDMDRETFCGIAESITGLATRITVYASRHDQALAISRNLHRGSRAGEAGPEIVLIKNVQTIDVGDVDKSFRGHSYVFENETVLTDIRSALHGDSVDKVRKLAARAIQALPYWAMGAAAP
jgi:esterase/lipase superfamily enzyme